MCKPIQYLGELVLPPSQIATLLQIFLSAHHILCCKSFTARFWQRLHTAKDEYTVSTDAYKHKRHKWIYSQSIWEISLVIFYLLILNIFIKGKLIVLHYLMKTKYRFHLPKSLNIYYQSTQQPAVLARCNPHPQNFLDTDLFVVVHADESEWQQSGRT